VRGVPRDASTSAPGSGWLWESKRRRQKCLGMAWLLSVPLCRPASSPPLPPWSLTLSWQWHVLLFLPRDGKQLYAQLENIFRCREDGLVTTAARLAYEMLGKPFQQQSVPHPFGSAAWRGVLGGWQRHRRVPLLPASHCRRAPSLRTRNAFHSSSAEPVGAAGLRRNIAERLRNAELEPLHVLAEAARSSVPASLPAPPAWLCGSRTPALQLAPGQNRMQETFVHHRSCP